MGLLKNLLKNTIGNGIAEGIQNAVSKATEKVLAPEAEKLANQAAEQLGAASGTITETVHQVTDNAIFEGPLKHFPRWSYSPVKDLSDDEGDDFVAFLVTVDLTDETVEAYTKALADNGFAGDFQIRKKVVDGVTYIVDFSFVPDGQLHYVIQK